MTDDRMSIARRAFVGGLGVGAAVIGAELPVGARAATAPWQPAMDPQDAWLDMPAKHRLAFDAISANGTGDAIFFADNFINANKTGYKLEASDLGVVIVVRHFATVFGYNDAMWAKYGAFFSKLASFTDPKTKKVPRANLYNASGYEKLLPNHGVKLSDLHGLGVQFAVCGLATQIFSDMMAKQGLGKADEIHADLTANLVAGSHLVAAGIVAVNRTQEHGYAVAHAG